jgi:hypothetical protein
MFNLSAAEAITKATHLKALGQTTVYLYSDTDFPYDKVHSVEAGSSWRLGGPSSCYLDALVAGLTLKLSVDFESRDANGRGVSLFERDRLRNLFLKLPPKPRRDFADLLERECLPGLMARRTQLQTALSEQADSEDCVRGLILFAREKQAA